MNGYPPPPPSHTHTHTLARTQIMYFDGQFDDARYNVALACTAAAAGGTVANYVEVQQLIKVGGGVMCPSPTGPTSQAILARPRMQCELRV